MQLLDTLSPEERATIYCARLKLDTDRRTCLEQLLRSGTFDWNKFITLIMQHGLGPLAQFHLSTFDSQLIPPASRAALFLAASDVAMRNRVMQAALDEIGCAAQAEGIPVMVLKGIALGIDVYGNPALRNSVDIDLLIRQHHAAVMHSLLLRLGYQTPSYASPEHPDWTERSYIRATVERIWWLTPESPANGQSGSRNHEMLLELHTTCFEAVAHRSIRAHQPSEFWQRANPLTGMRSRLLTMEPTHMLFYICYHAGKHLYDIKQLCDIDAIVTRYGETIDWPAFLKLAARLHLRPLLYYALWYTHLLLDTHIPNEILAGLKPDILKQQIAANLVPVYQVATGTVTSDEIKRQLFHVCMTDGWAYPLQSLWALAFPGISEVAANYRSRGGRYIYLQRILVWLRRAGKSVTAGKQ